MSELDYLRTIDRQRGSNAAIAIAAETIEKLRARLAVTEAVIKTARGLLPPEPEIQGWWCRSCLAFVSPQAVTHNECHELCGTPVMPVGQEPPKVAALRTALANLKAGDAQTKQGHSLSPNHTLVDYGYPELGQGEQRPGER